MDDGGRAGVEKLQSLQDLATPTLQHLQVDFAKATKIPVGVMGGEVVVGVEPAIRTCHTKSP